MNNKKMKISNNGDIDADVMLASKIIIEKDLIVLEKNEKSDKEEMTALFPYKICDLGVKGEKDLISNLMKYEVNKNNSFSRIISQTKEYKLSVDKCKKPICKFKSCPLLVSAYFKSLIDEDNLSKESIIDLIDGNDVESIKENISKLIGIDSVKDNLKQLIKFFDKVRSNKYNDLHEQYYNNFAFLGNDGLQQDKVANLVQLILLNSKMKDKMELLDYYALDLKFDSRKSQTNLSDIENEILKEFEKREFIYIKNFDYILQLKSTNENYYQKFINTMMRLLVVQKNGSTLVISGKKDQMEIIFNENPEFASIFGYKWYFEDYDVNLLTSLFIQKLGENDLKIEIDNDELKDHISQLLKESNFDNLYFLEELCSKTIKNSILKDENAITLNTLPQTKDSISIDETMKEIDELIGMNQIKNELRNLSKFLSYNKKMEQATGITKQLNLHMVFSGNAGTGKTTVARLLANILYNMGYIQEKKITEITPKDLIGEFLGQTAPKTRRTIESALGGILFIDEAYSLNSKVKNGYSGEAIVELLKALEDFQGKLVVIFAGYSDEMKEFIDLNPGLKSRISYYIDFEDYDEEELIEILKLKLSKLKLTIDEESLRTLKRVISFNKKAKNFGNGRYVDNLVNNLLVKHAINSNDENEDNLLNITIEDVNLLNETNDINITDIFSELNQLIGLENIKRELHNLVDYLNYNKKLEKENIYPKSLNLHMVFSGNSGTGKTTVARMLSNIFYSLGYIPEDRVIEVTAKDLTGEYLGQTAPKVKRVIENALGGILFIDEAYILAQSQGGYSDEAIVELLVGMEKYYDRLIIIFSGYKDEMKKFVDKNPGLKSRIGRHFSFEDYNEEELLEIFVKIIEENKLKITEEAKEKAKKLFTSSMKIKNFGNGRFVRNAFDKIIVKHSTNVKNAEDKETLITITENDIDENEIKKTVSTKSTFGFNLKNEKSETKEIDDIEQNNMEVLDMPVLIEKGDEVL